MIIKTIKTRILIPPKDDLPQVILESVKSVSEKSVIVVTSKVISIWQGQCISVTTFPYKDKLIRLEADKYLPRKLVPGAWVMHTLKNNIFIPSAGIDESNANDHYILWPKNPKAVAKKLWQWFRQKYGIKNLGIVISDSHTIPLRRGTMGISIAHYGFVPLRDYRGTPDLFGRILKMSQTDVADGMAAAAVLAMGEGKEATPLAIIRNVPGIRFVDKPTRNRKPFSSFEIKTNEDLYYPLLSAMRWRKGRGGYRIRNIK